MPQNNNANKKKKKKGHAPAHQNTFAYKHNPKSKKTQKILESPNIHVCRRCHEKIEWRKQYRKYKPRTQPGKCNECQKRNVLAAYHTICESCTIHSVKAKEIIDQSCKPADTKKRDSKEEQKVDNQVDSNAADDNDGNDQVQQQPQIQKEHQQKLLALTNPEKVVRACAVCVKEIALPDPEEEGDEDVISSLGRMKLRERRTLERQLAAANNKDDDDGKKTGTMPGDNIDDERVQNKDLVTLDEDSDEEDELLKAVGGADQLLVGEQYQKRLLEQSA